MQARLPLRNAAYPSGGRIHFPVMLLLSVVGCGSASPAPSEQQAGEVIAATGGAGAAAAAGRGGASAVAAGSAGGSTATGGAAGRTASGNTMGATAGRAASAGAGVAASPAGANAAAAGSGAGTTGAGPTGGVSAAAGGAGATTPAAGSGAAGTAAAEDCGGEAQPMPGTLMLSGSLGTHDPTLIEADGRYYLFNTGRGIPAKTSADLKTWENAPAVFSRNPDWIAQKVDGATDLWAPDISFWNGLYHLFYSASTFGSNHSCIGHATRESLANGQWQDRGPVICSNDGSRDDWNAIDPNLVLDDKGAPWLSFGSFWSGLKLIALDQDGARSGTEVIALATREENGRSIEAPVIKYRCGYYYLFASYDRCCQGADSTYNVRVGRSRELKGPYEDEAGLAMLDGGGTRLVEGDARWKGPGHSAVIQTPMGWFNVYHAYAASNGNSTLRVSELQWNTEGWPVSGGP